MLLPTSASLAISPCSSELGGSGKSPTRPSPHRTANALGRGPCRLSIVVCRNEPPVHHQALVFSVRSHASPQFHLLYTEPAPTLSDGPSAITGRRPLNWGVWSPHTAWWIFGALGGPSPVPGAPVPLVVATSWRCPLQATPTGSHRCRTDSGFCTPVLFYLRRHAAAGPSIRTSDDRPHIEPRTGAEVTRGAP